MCVCVYGSAWVLKRSRQKRVSDQRLAELETLLALARLKGRMSGSRSSYGFLRIDPAKMYVFRADNHMGELPLIGLRMKPIGLVGVGSDQSDRL